MIQCHFCNAQFPGDMKKIARPEAKSLGWQYYVPMPEGGRRVDICPVCAVIRRKRLIESLIAFASGRKQIAGRFVKCPVGCAGQS